MQPLIKLKDLSFQDIHFGRCDIVDDKGYKDFILCYLKQLHILDGVLITHDKEIAAQELFKNEVNQFNNVLYDIENDYRKEIQSIGTKQQTSSSQAVILENEMISSLKELEGLVNEGRNVIQSQLMNQESLFESNLRSLESNINSITNKTNIMIDKQINKDIYEFDFIESQFCILERIAIIETELMSIFSKLQPSNQYETVAMHLPWRKKLFF